MSGSSRYILLAHVGGPESWSNLIGYSNVSGAAMYSHAEEVVVQVWSNLLPGFRSWTQEGEEKGALGRSGGEVKIQLRRSWKLGGQDAVEKGLAGGETAPGLGEKEDGFVAAAAGDGAAQEQGGADGGGAALGEARVQTLEPAE